MLDGASKATLENEFGTSNEDECIIKILESGEVQKTHVRNHSILQKLSAHEANATVHRTVSAAEAATIPRGLWLDLARISEAADLAGMDQNMDTTCKQKHSYTQVGS